MAKSRQSARLSQSCHMRNLGPPRLPLAKQTKTLKGVGGAIASPVTAYQYDCRRLAFSSLKQASPCAGTLECGGDGLCLRMCVSDEHSRVSVAADGGDFRHVQTFLEEPANCLVAQVVEPQAGHPRTSS